MPTITQIKVGDTTYDIRDSQAQQRTLPTGGTTNQILKKASNTNYDAVWVDGTGSDWSDITNKPESFPPSSHNHDDRYYTETEVDTALAGKAAASHTHDDRYYTETEVDTALAGKAASNHNHDSAYAAKSHTHDDRYYTETEMDTKLAGKAASNHNHDTAYAAIDHDHDSDYAPISHTHDDRYYTETEVDTALAGKAASNHNHDTTYAAINHNHDTSYAGISHTHDDRYYTETEVDTALALKSDKTQDAHHIYFVKGTQGSSTSAWTGTLSEVSALYEGLIIDYWLPYASTSSNVSLTLTLKDNVTTDAIPVYYQSNNRMTTQQTVNTIWQYVYQTVTISGTSFTGWWAIRAYDTDTTYDHMSDLTHDGAGYTADSVIYRYQLLFHVSNDVLTPMNNDSNKTGTTKTILTNVEFDPFGEILYYASTTTVNAGSSISSNLYYARKTFDLRYSFNLSTNDGLETSKDLYLQVLMQSNGKCKLASGRPLTTTLPSTNDGIHYIFLGRMSGNSIYSVCLFHNHPVYYHDGTSLRILNNVASLPVASYDSSTETLEISF